MVDFKNFELFKEQKFFVPNWVEFFSNAVRRSDEGQLVVLVAIGPEKMDIYPTRDVDSLGMFNGDNPLPMKLCVHNGITPEQIEHLFDDESVRFVSLMVTAGCYTIQFSLFRKDIGDRTKLTCAYESVDELAFAIEFLENNVR